MKQTALQKPLRLWPGVVLVVLQWLGWFVIPKITDNPDAVMYGMIGGVLLGPVILIWWAFFSRAHWAERWGAVALVVLAMMAVPPLLHRSVREGNMGFQFYGFAIPVLGLAFVIWVLASRRLSAAPRRATMAATILLACGSFTLLRSDGLIGAGFPEFTWRWAESAEERLLAQEDDEFAKVPATPAASAEAEWAGFLGPEHDGVIRGLHIDTDWSALPPVEVWRRPVGPGTSSFAVGDELLYTQEQRGEYEVVACYKVSTGEPVWRHSDEARYWDSHVGAGPRATPALSGGRLYSFGATGILNALDARSGRVEWSRNAAAETGAKIPYFGFVNSPLVVDDVVIVNTNKLVAYDLASGELRWRGPDKGASYSSPQLFTIKGVRQILMASGGSLNSVAPADGSLLWEYRLPAGSGCVVQPVQTAQGDLLISTMVSASASPVGTLCLAVVQGSGGWTTEERWVSKALRPSFSQVVVHAGHAFGFDNRILSCIGLEDGKRKWKGGRFGNGHLMLLADQNLLLVVSEQGELALVEATPEKFTELGRIPTIEGRTWNYPALVRDVVLVRNSQEMAAFRLPLAVDRVGR